MSEKDHIKKCAKVYILKYVLAYLAVTFSFVMAGLMLIISFAYNEAYIIFFSLVIAPFFLILNAFLLANFYKKRFLKKLKASNK